MSKRQPSPLDVLEARVKQLAAALAALAPATAPSESVSTQLDPPNRRSTTEPDRDDSRKDPGKGLAPPASER